MALHCCRYLPDNIHAALAPEPHSPPMIDSPHAADQLLVFAHIPKTAGTSLLGVIRKNYPFWKREMLYGPKGEARRDAIAQGEMQLRNVNCVCCHHAQKILRRLSRPYRVFTLLRHPVELNISLYHYLMSNASAGEDGKTVVDSIGEQRWSLEDIYRNVAGKDPRPFNLGPFFNMQSKALCNVLRVANASETGHQAGHAALLANCQAQQPATPEQAARLAQQLLELWEQHGFVIGLTEAYEESVDLFARAFGWNKKPILHERVGNRPRGQQISDATKQLILESNQVDLALWELVASKFKRIQH